YSHIVMMIPKPQRIPFWKNNILVYQLPVWICIYTIIPVLSVIVFRYAHFRKNTDKKNFGSSVGNNIFFVLGLSLNVSANKIPKSWNLRVLL
ncbi:Ionotropic receptor 167, partial [Diabrotica virgifera virgifera]